MLFLSLLYVALITVSTFVSHLLLQMVLFWHRREDLSGLGTRRCCFGECKSRAHATRVIPNTYTMTLKSCIYVSYPDLTS